MSQPPFLPDPAPPPEYAGGETATVAALREALQRQDSEDIRNQLSDLHPADAADVLRAFQRDAQLALLQALPTEPLSQILSYLDEGTKAEILPALDTRRLAAAVAELDTDDALDLIDAVDEERKEELLAAVPAPDRIVLEEGLTFPEDSAGRLMQREVVALPLHWTVGQTIDFLRENEKLTDDTFYEIYLVDPRHVPVGTLLPSKLLCSRRPVALQDIMQTEFRTLRAETDQEDVAFQFRKYGLISAPVVDDAGRLIGVVTVDDVVDVIREEADEDILRLSGVRDFADFYRASMATARSRFWWLLINLGTAVLASWVISFFEGSIQQIVALAVLMPIVASMGGNAGMQTLTVIVRAIATRQLGRRNFRRILGKEVIVGLVNGILFASLAGGIAGVWFDSTGIGFVIAAAMMINLLVAALAGALIPMGLRKLGADPAIASSVFLTTATDVVGFLAFLGLAALFLV
jgi:magnesium transporter